MQHDQFQKQFNFGMAPTPKSTPGDLTHAFKLKCRLICFISITPMPACKISAKILTTVIAQFKYLTFDPLSGAKGVVYNFDTAMYL